MAELQPIVVFHCRHFVRHLEICNPICVKLLQIMSGVIPPNLNKIDVSISNRFPEVHKLLRVIRRSNPKARAGSESKSTGIRPDLMPMNP